MRHLIGRLWTRHQIHNHWSIYRIHILQIYLEKSSDIYVKLYNRKKLWILTPHLKNSTGALHVLYGTSFIRLSADIYLTLKYMFIVPYEIKYNYYRL